jgi:hypothetical protein
VTPGLHRRFRREDLVAFRATQLVHPYAADSGPAALRAS